MPRPARTAKKLAQRIDLQYFRGSHPLRRWRFLLSLGASAAALLWLAWASAAHNHHIYSSGSMSRAHAVFGLQCGTCHLARADSFRRLPDDRACLACHDGPIHHADQVFTPRCADCHREHGGRVRLADTRDSACTECHAHLRTKSGSSAFAPDIEGFNTRHPQFAPLRQGYKDPGTIKLNHFVHLKANLRGPDGSLVQLTCADCHRTPAIRAPWPYATPELRTVAAQEKQNPFVPVQTRAYLAPPEYAKACAACHPLLFDQRFTEPVPHDTPEVVHGFVVKKFEEYIGGHPAELRSVSARLWLPEKPIPPPPRVLTPREWVAERVAEAEDLLWRKTCKECHTMVFSLAAARPSVAKSAITVRWLPHAVFDHESHTMLSCTSCHLAALTSRETADVLLPGIETCQQCHHSGPEAAEARCFECHTYHNWSRRKEVQGKYNIPALVRGTASPGGEKGASSR
ncbi:MAG TPA: hypothetical protein VHM88_23620 [Candidatus Acidoferrales bacterium]|nr:hypothetical protein [Candidatus Acidoferrales bacterium]